MNSYNQQNVVRIVESVLPEVRKSGDPHSALLKRASELNLPPSVLEKCGQAFNTAKTLHHLDRSEDLEKRGSSFKTLDVPALVKAYTDYKPEKDSLWEKAASADETIPSSDVYSVPRHLNPLCNEGEKLLKKKASDKPTVHSTQIENDESWKKKSAEINSLKRDIQTTRTIVYDIGEKISKQASVISGHYTKLNLDVPEFDILEKECISLYPDKNIKRAFDVLSSVIENKSPASVDRVKRAKDETKVSPLIREKELHGRVSELADLCSLYKSAKNELADLNEKLAAWDPERQFNNDGKNNNGGKNKNTKTKNRPPKTVLGPGGSPDTQNKPGGSPGTQNKPDKLSEKGLSILPGLHQRIRQVIQDSKEPREYSKSLVDRIAKKDNERVNKFQKEVDRAAEYAKGEAALNTLLLTDPVISEYDEEQMRDIFFTIFKNNPDAATDISQLRGILRTAGQFEGVVDLDTIKTLRSLDRESHDDDDNKKNKPSS